MMLRERRLQLASQPGRTRDGRPGHIPDDGLQQVAFEFRARRRPEELPPNLALVSEPGPEALSEPGVHAAARAQEEVDGDIPVPNLADEARELAQSPVGGVLVGPDLGERDQESMRDPEFAEVPVESVQRLGVRHLAVGCGSETIFGPTGRPGDLGPKDRRLPGRGFGWGHGNLSGYEAAAGRCSVTIVSRRGKLRRWPDHRRRATSTVSIRNPTSVPRRAVSRSPGT